MVAIHGTRPTSIECYPEGVRSWLASVIVSLSATALACSTAEVVGLPDDSGSEAAPLGDATTNDATTSDATVDAADDSTQDSAAPPDATDAGAQVDAADAALPGDAGDAGALVDTGSAPDGCSACDGALCCAPFVCRASGYCSSCLGTNESCGGPQDCCFHVCEAGLCL
jgi:hypothetical protein